MLEKLRLALKAARIGEVGYGSQEFTNALLTVIATSIAIIADIYIEKSGYELSENDD